MAKAGRCQTCGVRWRWTKELKLSKCRCPKDGGLLKGFKRRDSKGESVVTHPTTLNMVSGDYVAWCDVAPKVGPGGDS